MNKKILADLHTHLNEKKIKPEDWWKAVKKEKLSIVAITEHIEYNPELAYKKLLEKKPKKIILIPGMEANTTAGHLLIYGKDDSIYKIKELQKKKANIEKVLKIVKQKKLIASFSHPYGWKTDSSCLIIGEKRTKKLLKKYSVGVEYYNGMLGTANYYLFNKNTIRKLHDFLDLAEKNRPAKILMLHKPTSKIKQKIQKIVIETLERVRKGMIISQKAKFITAGSDAHYPKNIGGGIIEFKKMPKNNKEFLELLKKRKFVYAGPNIYSKEPIDELKKKEMLLGIKYILQSKIRKPKIIEKIAKKMIGRKILTKAKRKIFSKKIIKIKPQKIFKINPKKLFKKITPIITKKTNIKKIK